MQHVTLYSEFGAPSNLTSTIVSIWEDNMMYTLPTLNTMTVLAGYHSVLQDN